MHFPQKPTLLALGLTLFLLPACGDDDPIGPPPVHTDGDFAFDLTVTDASGAPVSGLEATLQVHLIDNPIAAFGRDALAAKTVIEFQLAQTARATLTVYELNGDLVRVVVDGELAAGVHLVSFDGRDDQGVELLGTRVLRYEVVASDAEATEVMRESRYMTMHRSIDFEASPVLGTTNAAGVIALVDQNLFSGTFELPRLDGANENGDPVGSFSVSRVVTVTLVDRATGGRAAYELDVWPGGNHFRVEWMPSTPKGVAIGGSKAPLTAIALGRDAVPPVEGFLLKQNYPNPFN